MNSDGKDRGRDECSHVQGIQKRFLNNFTCLHDVRMHCKPLVECFCCKWSKSTYTSIHHLYTIYTPSTHHLYSA